MQLSRNKISPQQIEELFASKLTAYDAVVVVDYNFTYLYVNALAQMFFGKSEAALIGKKPADLFPEQWNLSLFKSSQKAVCEKNHVEMEYLSPFVKKWIHLVGTPYPDYYTFRYHVIAYKELLEDELRKELGRKKR